MVMVLLTPDCFSDYSHWVEYIRQLHGCGATIVATDGKSIQHIWENIVAESDRVDDGYLSEEAWARQAVEQWDRGSAIDDD